jgi:UDP-glucose 4-epimerase
MRAEQHISIVSGGAGFIATTLIEKLMSEGKAVVAVDNLSRGSRSNLIHASSNKLFYFIENDISNSKGASEVFEQASRLGEVLEVWHLAANSDIQAGTENPYIDLRDTFLTTYELLCQMRKFNVRKLFFASSSAVYGDHGDLELNETSSQLMPISNYGAMKLASEAIISAAAENALESVSIFRFPNVVGTPATHGVIFDFIRKLIQNPNKLKVLGNGQQQKAYLHVTDLVNAMLTVRAKAEGKRRNVVNVGPIDQGVTVRWIAEQVTQRISPSAGIEFGLGDRGWVGDVPKFRYSIDKMRSYGWTPQLDSAGAILRAIDEIAIQLGR